MSTLREFLIWHNFVTIPHRWMAYWLRRRGWVCFYLDQSSRECRAVCWLKLYQESESAVTAKASTR